VSGGQDHFYLEGQIALALPGEDGDMVVRSSTQHPTEVQRAVAHALGRRDNAVTVEVRRMGGGFGGKESQAALFAVIAALLADRTGRPVKARADRDDDMIMTGKRHDFVIDYEVGFDDSGRILGIEFELAARCGMSADLSVAVCERAMFHCDNAYYLANATIDSHRCKTNTVSNTAFRGFGGPQGMMGIEDAVDEIARYLDKDPLEVRRRNLYGKRGRDVTPYYMKVEDNILPRLLDELEASADYAERRRAIRAFNATSPVLKKGIALTPVKFGIAFTTATMNQGAALVHVYTDGSVHLNHGGTEMGQGLFVKVAQIVAEVFQIDLERIKVTATNTGKVPPRPRRAPTSTARPRPSRPPRSATASPPSPPSATACRPRPWSSAAARSAWAGSASRLPRWCARAGWPGCRSRRPASSARPRSTSTSRPGAAAPSATSPTAPRWPRW
jgi:xanthine dehydrogenase large subunit